MAESRASQKASLRTLAEGRPGAPGKRSQLSVYSPVVVPRRRRPRVDDHFYEIESDLSGDMAVSEQELDAIARLLGDEIEELLSGGG
jgi:hypothetical protein